MTHKYLNKKGFSFIEILLVVATMGILMVVGLISFRSFEKRLELNTTVNDVISAMHLAFERTISSKDDDQYGVHLENDFYAIYKGFEWDPDDPENEIYYFPVGIEYVDIWGSSNASVVFDRITGTSDHVGDIILRLIDNTDENRVIKVFPSGRVGLDSTLSLTDTRLTDSRHVHFDLGWSLQGSDNLELVFHDPPGADVSTDIPMATFFNGDQTEFDWEGSIDVNGEIQTLRIHTHSLDVFDTALSIHRDGRYNTKAVDISVDGKDIVSIDVDGVSVVGIFGGDMEVQ